MVTNSLSSTYDRSRHRFNHVSRLALGSTLAFAALHTNPAVAQDKATFPGGAETANAGNKEIVVTGSRRAVRSLLEVPAPVDIFSADELQRQPSPDLSNNIRNIAPSINVNDNSISGTSAAIRPIELRGLSPDHTLVLINGKRMNRSPDIPTFSGGISDGSQSPDISVLPMIALKQVQVLRDGAAAQYGADAIAGVINFIMNDAPTGGSVQAQFGSTYAGDGNTYQIAGTYGTQLGSSGFVRFSAEYSSNDRAVRAVQRSDAAALAATGNNFIPNPATRFATPQVRKNVKLFANFAVENGLGGEFYGFGGYNARRVNVDFFYRNPQDRTAVYTDGAGSYLVGDMTPDDGDTCPGTGSDKIAINAPDAAARLEQVAANPNCFAAINVFPGGYTPYFTSTLSTVYGTLGMRGEILPDLKYDLSLGASRYKMKVNVTNSLNPSLGTQSPTDFSNNGARIQQEIVANADLTYPIEVGFATPLNVAAGFEWHKERFEAVAGQPESYETGVLATQGFLIGEDAYPGYSPEIAGAVARSNISLYLDLATNPIKQLDVGAAVRYERFTDVGSKMTYKLSSMYHLPAGFAVRGTYATGFHAPSPGQQAFTGLTTELTASGALLSSGILPATNPLAQLVGGQPLKPETSKSVSVGLVFERPWLSLSIDYFNIRMKNRLTQSQSFNITDAQRAQLVAEGFAFAGSIGSFRFFTNDFSSQTSGVDVVATVPMRLFGQGRQSVTLNANYTKNKVLGFDPTDPNELLSELRVIQLEKNLPRYRGNISFNHSDNKWHAMARVNYYGKYTELHVNSLGLRLNAGSEITADAEVGYKIFSNLEVSVGAQNIFNNYPDLNPYRFSLGSKYPTTSPMGISGGTYYARLGFDF